MASPESKRTLLDLIDRFHSTPMLVVGDLIVDHYIWGKVDRISPEAPVVVVQVTEENRRLGGASNVANNLVALGATVNISGVVGDDDEGKTLLSLLEKQGIQTEGVVQEQSRPTTVKTRVIAHAQQVVRIDREVNKLPSPPTQKELTTFLSNEIKKNKGVILSDYAKGLFSSSFFEVFSQPKIKELFGLGKIPLLIDPKAPNFSLYKNATVIKPNRSEAERAAQAEIHTQEDAIEVGRKLLEIWDTQAVLITLGEDGMVFVPRERGQEVSVDTVAQDVYDVSGAGDTVSAVFTLALAVGGTFLQASELANLAAGVVVGEVGTVRIEEDQLREAVLLQE